jgi:peptidylprolyl isomerase domain and WD repeat-containing protein 1
MADAQEPADIAAATRKRARISDQAAPDDEQAPDPAPAAMEEDDDEDDIGPMPMPADDAAGDTAVRKKRKGQSSLVLNSVRRQLTRGSSVAP